ncbi:TIGR00374 family protein [Marinitenerispora sediminis]|uniref:TIGR00374 family protein n=2 Tax=Marinitenerispora sediminis TaxID=1931232 RepID=A0A368T0N6_9ACTN|nr:TIGR00374 family protein [Marinitenerispora sediminis]RCV51280.1 TIGR00374 family protein [Marinitenerispora sediminis]RCV52927.1 TIGR00374 family protein [Marinitenerispora sediminis]
MTRGGTARRPLDLVLALVGVLVVAAVLVLVRLTAAGVPRPSEAEELRALLPSALLALVAGVANLTVIVLACAASVERLVHRQFRDVARALTAAALGYLLAIGVNAVTGMLAGPGGLPAVLAGTGADGTLGHPLHGYLASVVAYARAATLGHLPRVRAVIWGGIAVTAASVLLSGYATALALLLTLVLGLTSALVARYAVGLAGPPLATDRLVRELRRFGFEPLGLTALGTDPEGDQRYAVDLADRRLDLTVLRADVSTGAWKRLIGRLLLRDPAAPPMLLSLRRRVEHAALLDYAAEAAGAAAPRLLAVGELGPGTAVLVREHRRTRLLDDIPAEEITDRLLAAVWSELALLHRHRVAHRNLSGRTIGVRMDGRIVFARISSGSIAAGTLAAGLDTAALLTTLALRVGARRAVGTAVRELGTEAVAATLPFLQPAGLPRAVREDLRSARGTLGEIRAEITRVAPDAPAGPAKLERMRPRTVVSFAIAVVVGAVLVSQLADVDLTTIRDASLSWSAVALLMSALCTFAAALALIGFVPMRLPLWRTVLVQLAGSFVRIAAPAGLGSLALNTRYVTQQGASTALAISAVGVSQFVGLVTHVPLLLVCAYLTGTAYPADFSPSVTLIAVAAVLSVLVAAVFALPGLRRMLLRRVRPYFQGVLPQLLDLAQQPRRLALGLGGTLLLTLAFVLCLYCSVRAFGGDARIAAVAVVFLAGNALGSAAPSPGGLGAVEAALLGGLTAVAGVPAGVALPAVLLFRLLTFWLPVLPGWAAFHHLTRRRAI